MLLARVIPIVWVENKHDLRLSFFLMQKSAKQGLKNKTFAMLMGAPSSRQS
jgi:hypothetical protein